MLDLLKLPERYLAQYGAEKVAEIVGTNATKFTLEMVNKLLAFDPAPLHEVQPLYSNPEKPPKLMILVPSTGPVDSRTMECLCAMKEPGMTLKTFNFWSSYHARNALAAQFLSSSSEWAYWSDGDMGPTFGDAKAWKQLVDAPQFPDLYAGVHTINRLLHHKKTLVGVAYRGRKRGAGFQFGESGGLEMKALLKRGPQQRLFPTTWIGFGGVLMHRSVLEDIIKQQGDELRVANDALRRRLGYEYAIFSTEDRSDCGDDIVCCRRAKKAGHQAYVDLSLFASHFSSQALNFQDP